MKKPKELQKLVQKISEKEINDIKDKLSKSSILDPHILRAMENGKNYVVISESIVKLLIEELCDAETFRTKGLYRRSVINTIIDHMYSLGYNVNCTEDAHGICVISLNISW